MTFALDAPETHEALYEVREDEEEYTRRVVYWIQGFRQGNQPTMQRLTGIFTLAGIALLFEIGLLATGLAVG